MIVPNLAYADAPAAIEWLCNTFGFEKKMVVPGPNGTVSHAQLTIGEKGLIMISSMRKGDDNITMKSPKFLNGLNTQACYIVIGDIDNHYEHTQSAGAEIIRKLVKQEYGGKDYMCRDCEGNIWSFGTYDPWKDQ